MSNERGFFYTDLSKRSDLSKAFEGLAPGTFRDMNNRKVVIKPEELPDYVANTLELIEASRTESGELIGLPIDMMNHEHGNAAGWIVGAELGEGHVKLIPRWTEAGLELISKDLQRLFSPTIITQEKTILGGSLTNWPATRDRSGKVLIRPIELSDGQVGFQIEEDNFVEKPIEEGVKAMTEITDEIRAELKSIVMDVASDLTVDPKIVNDLVGNITQKVTESIQRDAERLSRENQLAELAKGLVQGSDAHPRGIPTTADELQSHLSRLQPEDATFWGDLMSKIQKEGLVSFEELGHNGSGGKLKDLPVEVQRALDKKELTIADLSDSVLALGDLAEYDLTKWS